MSRVFLRLRGGKCRGIGLAVGILLVGCTQDPGIGDLNQFVETAHSEKKPVVEPLPVIPPYERFEYAASELPDPFSADNLDRRAPTSQGASPDADRRREPLEQFPLDALNMVGTMFRNDTAWVIVRAPDGTIHSARPGNYMGHNSGLITDIREDHVALRELVPGPVGDWEERMVRINVIN